MPGPQGGPSVGEWLSIQDRVRYGDPRSEPHREPTDTQRREWANQDRWKAGLREVQPDVDRMLPAIAPPADGRPSGWMASRGEILGWLGYGAAGAGIAAVAGVEGSIALTFTVGLVVSVYAVRMIERFVVVPRRTAGFDRQLAIVQQREDARAQLRQKLARERIRNQPSGNEG